MLTEYLLTHARFWVCLLALQSRRGEESKEKKEDNNNDLGMVSPALMKLRQGDYYFKAILEYIARPCL